MTIAVNAAGRPRRDPVPPHCYSLPIVREMPAQPVDRRSDPGW